MELTVHNALDQIQKMLATSKVEEVPDGWLTVEEWADAGGKSRSHANNLLVAAWRAGMIERRQFTISKDGNMAAIRPVWHYKAAR